MQGGDTADGVGLADAGSFPHAISELSAESTELVRLLQEAVAKSPAMAWISYSNAGFDFVNQRWLDFRARTMEQELGMGWWEGVHPADIDQCLLKYRNSLQYREPFRLEFQLRRADGRYEWFRLDGVPQYLLDGAFLGYVGSGRPAGPPDFQPQDATEPAMGRDIQPSQTRVLHDLLNAAAGLEMVGELLAESSLPEESAEFVKLLQNTIHQLSTAIQRGRVLLEDPHMPRRGLSAGERPENILPSEPKPTTAPKDRS